MTMKRSIFVFSAKLVAFDTSVIRHGEDGQEAKAQEWLAKYLENLGCEIEMFEPDNEKLKEYPGYNAGHSYVNRPNLIATYKWGAVEEKTACAETDMLILCHQEIWHVGNTTLGK